MFERKHRGENLPLIDLIDRDARSQLTLAPTRGGMLTSFQLNSMEFLYMDEPTLLDVGKNVRGGNPVLFPSPGKLAGDRWARGGQGGQLRQHGFARNLAWDVLSEGDGEVTLGIASSPATLADYPFEFAARYTYRLRGNEVQIRMHFDNRGAQAMPFGAGFHPYFAVSPGHKGQTLVETAATRAFDNTSKREVPYRLDLTAGEVDLHLLDHGSARSSLTWPAGRVTLEGSPEFTHWVIWTLPDRGFVCLEPWTCPGDALNTGERLLELAPGASRELTLTMRFEPA